MLVAPVTVALNWKLAPVFTVAVVGATVTATGTFTVNVEEATAVVSATLRAVIEYTCVKSKLAGAV